MRRRCLLLLLLLHHHHHHHRQHGRDSATDSRGGGGGSGVGGGDAGGGGLEGEAAVERARVRVLEGYLVLVSGVGSSVGRSSSTTPLLSLAYGCFCWHLYTRLPAGRWWEWGKAGVNERGREEGMGR
jgi:hypothetical protein